MRANRRVFLTTLSAALAAPALLRARPAKRYPIAFSTLGCPAWSWKTILEQADQLGYAAIELRGVAGEMDLTKVPELAGSRLVETRKDLAALGLVISDLGASSRMHEEGAGHPAGAVRRRPPLHRSRPRDAGRDVRMFWRTSSPKASRARRS